MTTQKKLVARLAGAVAVAFVASMALTWLLHDRMTARDAHKLIDVAFKDVQGAIREKVDRRLIRQAMLFEYRIGAGRLLVCSFKFGADDPAAAWLRARLVDYAASDAFDPLQKLTPEQLHAVINAPLLSGAKNQNRARNPGDPSSNVRAGIFAQP